MRKWIIDTDTGSDDAVAILVALLADDVEVLAMTTVTGNISMEQATRNCLQTMEEAGASVPVYRGADRPLMRSVVHATHVHGRDGLGDRGLVHPSGKACEDESAEDVILRLVKENPGEVEILAIGPVTNLAKAILKDPEGMKQAKAVWSMGTAGFGPGNVTPVAEFNVYGDAESYRILLQSKIPVYIAGFDVCLGDARWTREDMDYLAAAGKRAADFAVNCNLSKREFYKRQFGDESLGLPDAVLAAGALWEDLYELEPCIAHVCLEDPHTYGQVILYSGVHLETEIAKNARLQEGPTEPNCFVMKNFNGSEYKERVAALLTR